MANIGTVSSGSLRLVDTMPALLWELKRQKDLTARDLEVIALVDANYDDDEDADYYTTGQSMEDHEALCECLNNHALPYFYFGTHPGDGADYGWWLSDSFEYDFDGLKVSDTSDVPEDYTGEVLHVNDHGNVTLYSAERGELTEVWGVV
jgi:hypothetical protein